MKTIIVGGSTRVGANSDVIGEYAQELSKEKGNDVELINIRDLDVAYCQACNNCKETGSCKIKDDAVDFISKVQDADNVILIYPIYFGAIPGLVKTLIDRFYSVFTHDMVIEGKKRLGIVQTLGSPGDETTITIGEHTAFCFSVLGCTESKIVNCGDNNIPATFLDKEDQKTEVKTLVDWINQ